MKRIRVCVLSQANSRLGDYALLCGELLDKQVVVQSNNTLVYGSLPRALLEYQADCYLLGYPHTDQARLYGHTHSAEVDVTNGANALIVTDESNPKDPKRRALDTRVMGLFYLLKFREVPSIGRALVIGTQSAATAAAYAIQQHGIRDIDILNEAGMGNQAREWQGVKKPQGYYSLVVNTVSNHGFGPEVFSHLDSNVSVIDLAYQFKTTPLLEAARKNKAKIVDDGRVAAVLRVREALSPLLGGMADIEQLAERAQLKMTS